MTFITIIKDELVAGYEDSNPSHLSLVISNSDKRIQTVIVLKPEEVNNLTQAVVGYRLARGKIQ